MTNSLFNKDIYESRLAKLLELFLVNNVSSSFLEVFEYDSLMKVHEIGRALYLLVLRKYDCCKDKSFLNLTKTHTHAVCLFKGANFSWGALPHPGEHAELGSLLLQLSKYDEYYGKIAVKMLDFQQACFTHRRRHIFSSLFTQSIADNYLDTNKAGALFLANANVSCEENYTFVDEEIGFVSIRNSVASAYIAGSGCRSSSGSFLFRDIGIVAWGPHRESPENGQNFGISGHFHHFSVSKSYCSSMTVCFTSPLFSDCTRITGFRFLEDSGISASGIKVTAEISLLKYFLDIEFLNASDEKYYFSLFCKAYACQVGNGPRLRAYSLDSYRGPVENIILEGQEKESCLRIGNISGVKNMHIVSLPGNNTFWGANFLVIFNKIHDKISCCFTTIKENADSLILE